MKKIKQHIQFLFAVVATITLVACASIGRPEGGPRDEMPPVFIGSTPAPGATNVSSKRVELVFDENVQVNDVSNKVVISPAQKAMPSIITSGKKVIVELRDTLIPNTTYTIDFSDAIRDLNEGNPIDGFALDFSTGNVIDTLRVSGMLFEARNLEPAQGVIVGVHSNLADSAISTLKLERIAKTNQLGQFTVRGLKPGEYHIFALNDKNRDYRWDRTEDIAFFDTTISPTVVPIEVFDTLRAVDGTDSLVARQGTKYLPNNVLLTWFNEGWAAQYLKDYNRPERRRLTFNFATKSDTLPVITIANGPKAGLEAKDWALLNANATLDSLEYWIKDSAILAQDSLFVAAKYLRTDTNENLTWTTDTLKLFYKDPKEKKKKKDDEKTDSVPQLSFINWTLQAANPQNINRPLQFLSSQPIDSINNNGIKLSIKRDTIWEPVPNAKIIPDSAGNVLRFSRPYTWVSVSSVSYCSFPFNTFKFSLYSSFTFLPNIFVNSSSVDVTFKVVLLNDASSINLSAKYNEYISL